MENDNNSQAPHQERLQEKAENAKNSKSFVDILSTIIHEGEAMYALQNKTFF